MPVLDSSSNGPILNLLLLIAFISTVQCNTDELHLLLSFKSQLSNPPTLSTWQADGNPCNFTGITCDQAGSVTEIHLSGRELTGQLAIDSLCKLPSLQTLSLGSNSLFGPVLPDLNNCTRLHFLDLASNALTGSVPPFFALSQLRFLNLSDNRFTGHFPWNSLVNVTNLFSLIVGDNPFLEKSEFPQEIIKLTQLSNLYLTNCSLYGEIPPSIGDLTSLVNLELSHNNFIGAIPPEIAKLTELLQLEMWENHLTGEIPVGFRNLSKLQFFDASSNDLEGDIKELKYLTNLMSLQLFENQFTGEVPPEFGDFRSLVNLSLYSNRFSGTLPATIGSWSEFDYIDVSDNKFSGPIPPDMCKQGKMTQILILGNMFSGEFPASYANCKSLYRIRVNKNSFSGHIPAGIWGLPNVELIDLSDNQFEGPITEEISMAGKLAQLAIKNNRFSGELPEDISKASSLYSIDAESNEFSGEIPSGIGELKNLGSLLLQRNKFSGRIPDSLASCSSVHEINLAENALVGHIPASLGSLQYLNSLNLSSNQLSGPIPASIVGLKLSLFDLSENQLSGPVPEPLSQGYSDSFVGNPGLCSQTIHYLRQCSMNSSNSGHLKTLISSFLGGTALLLVSFGCFLFFKRKRGDFVRPIKDSWNLKSFRLLSFTEQEILNGIKRENVIGEGGSGNVYKVILANGKELAVKHIWNSDSSNVNRKSSTAMLKRARNLPEFDAEVATLSSIRHVNVVKLYCSITSEDSSLLVYEYLPNGSLWDKLHVSQKMGLDWRTRYEIAMGAAKGLEYLHHGCDRPVIHRDVKSSNILLDEFFKPRIADFGLAKIVQAGEAKDSTHVIAGTHGYIAPEYAYTWKVSEKSDVYSFGVVLMELVTGKRPIELEFGENKDIVYWVTRHMMSKESLFDLVDAQLTDITKEDAVKVLRIAILCTAKLPALRPSMRMVVQMLEDAEPLNVIDIKIEEEKKTGDNFEDSKEKNHQSR